MKRVVEAYNKAKKVFRRNKPERAFNLFEFQNNKRLRVAKFLAETYQYDEKTAIIEANKHLSIAWEAASNDITYRRRLANAAVHVLGFLAAGGIADKAIMTSNTNLLLGAFALGMGTVILSYGLNEAYAPQMTKPSAANDYKPAKGDEGCKAVYRRAEEHIELWIQKEQKMLEKRRAALLAPTQG